MKLVNEFDPIREWARERGLLMSGDIKTQSLKAAEEIGELAKAVIEGKPDHVKDAIGDIVVVLVSVAFFNGMTIEACINHAYEVIKNRTGKMVGETWVRDQ
jgi:NTP pyrophosphatase (non-canonical NTP hydrolase)